MIWTFWGQRRFGPGDLFVTGAPGAFYDPSDFSTLFQDSAGTTPVTAVEQPVGLMLDRSRGLVLGSELVSNGTFAGATGWTVPAGWQITGGQAVATATSSSLFGGQMTTVAGRWYRVEFDVIAYTSGDLSITVGANYSGQVVLTTPQMTPGRKTVFILGGASTTRGVEFYGGAVSCAIDNVSVRELPGNHATQSTSAARPTLRARYNLLTRTEEFDDAAWTTVNATVTANAGVAPNGTTTADKLIETTATGLHTILPTAFPSLTIGAVYTVSLYAKAAERSLLCLRDNGTSNAGAFFDLATGVVTSQESGVLTASITNVGSGWFRCVVTYAAGSTSANIQLRLVSTGTTQSYTGDGTSGLLLWGAQLLTAADATATGGAYQRVGAATDYAVGGPFRPYLAFDGSDDSMSTASVDFSGTDEMTVFAGVTKLSDATRGMLVELSASYGNPGTFGIEPPTTPATADYGFISGGSVPAGGYAIASGFSAPITSVLTAIGDISADVASLRMNGVAAATNTGNQGTGNYSNAPLFIGSRNNASVRFNGRIYSLIVLGRTATAAEITATEAWVNSRTGAY